jgi:hypothetical protein
MVIRPIDLQVNFLRENDARELRTRDQMHDQGQLRYSSELIDEQAEKDKLVQTMEDAEFDEIKDGNKESDKGGKKGKKKKKDEEEAEKEGKFFADPARGTIIDIKMV